MASNTLVTRKDFDLIKILLETKTISSHKIATTVNRSLTTVRTIDKCTSWEDYITHKSNKLAKKHENTDYKVISKEVNDKDSQIKQAFSTFIKGSPKILGLSEDSKIYYYTNEGWKELNG